MDMADEIKTQAVTGKSADLLAETTAQGKIELTEQDLDQVSAGSTLALWGEGKHVKVDF
jgi:hypothetical protein